MTLHASDKVSADILHETSSGMNTPGGTFTLVRTLEVKVTDVFGNVTPRRKVRVTVRADPFYSSQCSYRVDAWDGSDWHTVVHIEGGDPDWRAPKGATPAAKEAFADSVADNLMGRALAVLL